MKRIFAFSSVLLFMLGGIAFAEQVRNLEQAKKLSAESGKPILLEFVHED
ncbi:MAG: hypothetical protein JSU69_05340 [Candidatus Zixiibacteriota bacterium]|nr:MAG: hypothetical protein JSU69_05340 [candidate division Zixibacteria bacterium]